MAVDPSSLGVVLICSLPRIRRSPCDTDSAATKHGSKGTVEYMEGARRRRSGSDGGGGKAAVYAAKGPCARARGATVRTAGGRRKRERSAEPTREIGAAAQERTLVRGA